MPKRLFDRHERVRFVPLEHVQGRNGGTDRGDACPVMAKSVSYECQDPGLPLDHEYPDPVRT
jgi:hypothetical protein